MNEICGWEVNKISGSMKHVVENEFKEKKF